MGLGQHGAEVEAVGRQGRRCGDNRSLFCADIGKRNFPHIKGWRGCRNDWRHRSGNSRDRLLGGGSTRLTDGEDVPAFGAADLGAPLRHLVVVKLELGPALLALNDHRQLR